MEPLRGLEKKRTDEINKDLRRAPLQPKKSTQLIPLKGESATIEIVTMGLRKTRVGLLVTTMTKKDTTRISVKSPRKTPCQKINKSLGDFQVDDLG